MRGTPRSGLRVRTYLEEVTKDGLRDNNFGAVWSVELHLVPGKVDAAGGALLWLVGAQANVGTHVLALTRVATGVGAVDAHQVAGEEVRL